MSASHVSAALRRLVRERAGERCEYCLVPEAMTWALLDDLKIGNIDPRHALPGARLPLNEITDAGLIHLKGLVSLKSLDLGGLPVSDEGLDVLKDLPNLGGLYLDRTKVRGPWFGRLKSLPGLAVVYLDGSAMTDERLSHLQSTVTMHLK